MPKAATWLFAAHAFKAEMMTEEDFFNTYCQGVLGYRYLPRPLGTVPLLWVVDLPWPEGLANHPMFRKMMGAISLPMQSIHVVECLPSEISERRGEFHELPYVLSFSPELTAALVEFVPAEQILTLEGPRDLIVHPERKRNTWVALQELAKRLASRC
ncbi:MAG: hypothetical protein C5B49_05000 [Bdellovibrio sp.]|nr:MAG: hypothetical protein C5B49_05000 [Bdellovibrio sp.]